MSYSEFSTKQRPEIALAWHRSKLKGLDPSQAIPETRLHDIDRSSSLMRAAEPVLAEMAGDLADTAFSALLADRSASIVDRRAGSRAEHRRLDRVMAVPGVQYLEEISGANSLATAFETRKPIAVAGDEHYLEALRVFCCYGAPIIHPITRRLEGVLDITGPASDQSHLIGPFLMRAVRNIERRLLEGSRLEEQHLFAEFQAASAGKGTAIMALGENLVLSNTAATDLIDSDDHAAIQAIADNLGPDNPSAYSLQLKSGREVDVRARLLREGTRGVLLEITPRPSADRDRSRSPRAATGHTPKTGAPRTVLITGPPGSGRSTRARQLLGATAVVADFGAESPESGWRSFIFRALASSSAVVFDNVHLADAVTAALIRRSLANSTANVVLICSDAHSLSDEHLAMAAHADEREDMPSLRESKSMFVHHVNRILANISASQGDKRPAGLRVTPSAMKVLADQEWPGNFTELTRVLTIAARDRVACDITVDDLPATHRAAPIRRLSPLERAERATILAALNAARGNKTKAAQALGIGRTTLYQKIGYYKIS